MMVRRDIVAALALALLVGACSGEADDRDSRPTDAAAASVVDDKQSVEAAYGDRLEALGVRVTRAGLSGGVGQEYGGRGRHLAIYVRPFEGKGSPKAQIDRIVPLIQTFVPDVFSRNRTITSFDVCQEPEAAQGSEVPPPETAFLVKRADLGDVDWAALTLEQVVQLAAEADPALDLSISAALSGTSEWTQVKKSANP